MLFVKSSISPSFPEASCPHFFRSHLVPHFHPKKTRPTVPHPTASTQLEIPIQSPDHPFTITPN
ncbi:hypothetical protein CBOM_07639 [Ceraceosorus bombacis]|uniref:Uncharacterized protein n=1 Tax=Ceraceosorus bombacis TaxID=401625 RepID=A0A0P1BKG5_9BASI|nr:hypothetical protein CBOM_07639 [Ceraceosorus bombacis]